MSHAAPDLVLSDAFYAVLLRRVLAEAEARDDVQRIKIEVARSMNVAGLPSNPDILARAAPADRARLLPLLLKKPTRTLSGVAIVTVQSPPEACPHGKCIYCPGGPGWRTAPEPSTQDGGVRILGTAQSYTGKEPAARRAARHGFDAFAQTASRLTDLDAAGHPVDKIDFIIQGGTFPARDPEAQREFVAHCYEAMNSFEPWQREHGGGGKAEEPDSNGIRALRSLPPSVFLGSTQERLAHAQRENETAHARMIGLTVETKPDWCVAPHVDLMLELGVTRVELGIQTLDEATLKFTNRGHTLADTYAACAAVKDAGLKLCAHVMPGQPGATMESDRAMFRDLFADERLRPDMLKIYPTLVVHDTPLARLMERGQFAPVTEDYCVELLASVKPAFPRWVRVQRIDRDIPTPEISGGVTHLNLRQMVQDEMKRRGTRCPCIRCREVGRNERSDAALAGPTVHEYTSSSGTEFFVEITRGRNESPAGPRLGPRENAASADACVAFARYRLPSAHAARGEARDALFLRELRVYGEEVALGAAAHGEKMQHRGLGSELLAFGESLARERGAARVVVTAGVGVREYYAKRGYARLGPYMAKRV
ncbi:MAG: tRNA uridine(34) 5-carboxymethylaminomethyl modification radical SAM/GNAT enzyme Elp3 [Thermoplasmatota archaeon]